MRVGNFNFSETAAYQLRIRWSDRHSRSMLEQDVELIRYESREWVIQSPVHIAEKTQVYLSGSFYTGNGIVRSCFREALAYILTIAMTVEECFAPPRQEFDPGPLEVDNFLTEEEEAKILDSLKNDVPYSLTIQRGALRTLWSMMRGTVQQFLRLQRQALCFRQPIDCLSRVGGGAFLSCTAVVLN